MCRDVSTTCLVTGEALGADSELHHPVRDGRPPVLLSKAGHDRIEGQQRLPATDVAEKELVALRRKTNLYHRHTCAGDVSICWKASRRFVQVRYVRQRTVLRQESLGRDASSLSGATRIGSTAKDSDPVVTARDRQWSTSGILPGTYPGASAIRCWPTFMQALPPAHG